MALTLEQPGHPHMLGRMRLGVGKGGAGGAGIQLPTDARGSRLHCLPEPPGKLLSVHSQAAVQTHV